MNLKQENLYQNIETPAYILRPSVLQKSIVKFKEALTQFFPHYILGYSVKTNSLPYILQTIKSYDGYAEVVSKDEFELALASGFTPSEIIYNGPLKSRETFLYALQEGSIVNIECKREIEWLSDLPKNKVFDIGIRVNIDLGEISPEDAKDNEDYSRFGFSISTGELDSALESIRKLENIRLTGLHLHRTTLSRSPTIYKKLATLVCDLIEKFDLQDVEKIDIGGGFYGIMENKPTFKEYCQNIYDGLHNRLDLNKITLIVEPGNAIVASAFDFLTSVIDVKHIRDFYICTTDGSRNDIDPFYKKENYFHEIIRNTPSQQYVEKQVIGGGTCLEYDKIFTLLNQEILREGDLILYKSVGAYTMTLSPLFIRFFPNIYLEHDGKYEILRNRWETKDCYSLLNTNNK